MLNRLIFYFSFDTLSKIFSSFSTLFTLLGTLLGTYLGYYLSDRQWKQQKSEQMKNVAKGISNEITAIEERIKPIVDDLMIVTVGSSNMLDSIIHDNNVDLNIYKSLYNESGLYFHFRKEIQDFDSSIVKDIEDFYTNLLSADKCYHAYMNLRYEQKNDMVEIGRIQDYMCKYLKKTSDASTKLKKSLGDYIKANS